MTEKQQVKTLRESIFDTLNTINVNDKKKAKNNLDYLSWAFAWGEVKKAFPEANSKVYEDANGMNYFNDGRTAWVKVGMTIEGLEHIEYLPIMDFKNKSIPLEKVTSMDVNKAIQRGLVKAIARHGLGLYIYAGEDFPDLTPEQLELEAEKQRLREIQPLILRAEKVGYPADKLDDLKTKTRQEIIEIMTKWKEEQEK